MDPFPKIIGSAITNISPYSLDMSKTYLTVGGTANYQSVIGPITTAPTPNYFPFILTYNLTAGAIL